MAGQRASGQFKVWTAAVTGAGWRFGLGFGPQLVADGFALASGKGTAC
jgi:hypothetical protein